jgi:hypothetical protein
MPNTNRDRDDRLVAKRFVVVCPLAGWVVEYMPGPIFTRDAREAKRFTSRQAGIVANMINRDTHRTDRAIVTERPASPWDNAIVP